MSTRPTDVIIGTESTFRWGVLVVMVSAAFILGGQLASMNEKLGSVIKLLEIHDVRINENATRGTANERVMTGYGSRIERLEQAKEK